MSDTHTAALDLSKLECWDWEFDGMSNKPNGYYFYRADVEALFRAAEGQAQTSAVAWTKFADRCPPEHAQIFWRHGKDAGTGYFMEEDKADWVGEWMFPFAAQLADSTAPGAPELPLLTKRYEFTSPDTGWFTAAQMRKYAADCVAAAPTAQQSLTAGGAVPDLPQLPPRDVHTGDEAFGDQVSAYSPFAMQEYAREAIKFAAAPLPQVQSEALDAARYHWLRAAAWDEIESVYWSHSVQSGSSPEACIAELDAAIDVAIAAQQAIKPSVDNDGGVA